MLKIDYLFFFQFFGVEKERERERQRKSRETGLIINEEWYEVNDDLFFKLLFDKNKREWNQDDQEVMKS